MSGLTSVTTKISLKEEIKEQQDTHQSLSFEQEQVAAFQLERERKASTMKARGTKEEARIGEFLKHVVEGGQDQAEELLKERPELALKKGTVTDLSKREFKHITGFQYAVWSLDWHMWQMLLKYLSKEAAALQFGELEEKGTAHEKHFNLAPLIEALNSYAKNHGAWYKAQTWDKMQQHWCEVVGGSQLLLPVHVVNEYCHPTRSFYPCPRFEEESLPRSRKCDGGEWFTSSHNCGKLGDKFGVFRYNLKAPASWEWDQLGCAYKATRDAEALQSLSKMRQQRLEELRVELQHLLDVRGLLNAYFPSVLSSTVVGYLG